MKTPRQKKGSAGSGRKAPAPDVTSKRGRKRDWAKAFFEAFRLIGVVGPAAAHAGVSRWAVRKRCVRDAEFAERFNEAVEESTDRMEAVAIGRATQAKDPSDTLLIFMLKARRPTVYRDNYRIEHASEDGRSVSPMPTSAVILLPQDGFDQAAAKFTDSNATPDDSAEPGSSMGVPGVQG